MRSAKIKSISLSSISTSATPIAFKLKTFNFRTMVKILIHIKYEKNENHLGIIRNNESTRKNIPANIKTYSLREMCPNTEYFLVRIFPHSD